MTASIHLSNDPETPVPAGIWHFAIAAGRDGTATGLINVIRLSTISKIAAEVAQRNEMSDDIDELILTGDPTQ
ncbi:hypothetical protein [Kitasatospora sp. NPDC057223]|uniref:hypothetical protein n=1 Tax=Kitasatospora sp. NPDC057223 TaxID=3346055 RepID=UPI00363E456C